MFVIYFKVYFNYKIYVIYYPSVKLDKYLKDNRDIFFGGEVGYQ